MSMAQHRHSVADPPAARDGKREFFLGPPAAVAAFAAAAGVLLLTGLALWYQHGLIIYVDMLATRIWNCF